MILITTAGKVGSEAARLLARQEEPVRVLLRDPEKATALAQAGAEVAEGVIWTSRRPSTQRCKASRPWCSSVRRYPPRS